MSEVDAGRPPMKTIALTNQKGGVGKTTTSVNLAAGLARLHYRVLLIDLDPQAHATVGLGVEPENLNGASMAEVLREEERHVRDAVTPTYLSGLSLAPATIRLAEADMLLFARPYREQRLQRALQALEGFDFVIVDCAPSLGLLSINAIVAADAYLIPTEPSAYAIRGVADLLTTVNTYKNSSAWDFRVLLTKVLPQATAINAAADKELLPLHAKLLGTRIHRSEALNRALFSAQPRDIGTFDPHSRAAREYQQLTEEVLQWLA